MLSQTETDYLKIVWALMLESGKATNGEWDYYTGWGGVAKGWDDKTPYMDNLRQAAVLRGIDLDASGVPDLVHNAEFVGTGYQSQQTESIIGTIVLRSDNSGERLRQLIVLEEPCDAIKSAYAALTDPARSNCARAAVEKYFGV